MGVQGPGCHTHHDSCVLSYSLEELSPVVNVSPPFGEKSNCSAFMTDSMKWPHLSFAYLQYLSMEVILACCFYSSCCQWLKQN